MLEGEPLDRRAARAEGARRPPLALRDSSAANARGLGHGEGYRYPHDFPEGYAGGSLMPEGLEAVRFYEPTDRGPEGELARRLRALRGEPAGGAGPAAEEPF